MTTIMRLKGGVPILMPYGKLIGVQRRNFEKNLFLRWMPPICQAFSSTSNGLIRLIARASGPWVEAYIIARQKKGRIGVINVGMNIKSLIIRTRLINIFEAFRQRGYCSRNTIKPC